MPSLAGHFPIIATPRLHLGDAALDWRRSVTIVRDDNRILAAAPLMTRQQRRRAIDKEIVADTLFQCRRPLLVSRHPTLRPIAAIWHRLRRYFHRLASLAVATPLAIFDTLDMRHREYGRVGKCACDACDR